MYGAKRSGLPPMIASMSGIPYLAARTTDSGLPPTPIHVVRRPLIGGRVHAQSLDRRARRAAPRHRCPRPIRLEEPGEQLQLLLEQRLVLVQRIAEERKRLDERATAEDDFGAAVRRGVERREPLKDAHRVVGAQHRDSGAEPDATRSTGNRGEDDLRRRDGEVGTVMLADADEIDAQLVGENGLVDDVADDLGLRERATVGVASDVAERVEPELEIWLHVS